MLTALLTFTSCPSPIHAGAGKASRLLSQHLLVVQPCFGLVCGRCGSQPAYIGHQSM